MEQDNLLEYLYRRLKNEHMWFVTKSDITSTWENKPKKYYALDEYGEIKDKSKVEKEINDYIGDGAETIQEAVSLFIADKVCDGSITTTDYLTTEFKDKPVEYTDTAVEVKNVEPKYIKPEITGSNKQVESKQLKEDIFDDVVNGKATYGVYDDKDTRNYKDRYKEPTYAKRNKIRNFKDDKFKQRSVRDIINKGVTHVDYEKMPNERVQAYKNSKKTENVQRRLNEENNKSLNLISDMFKSKDFDSDSKAGQIVMRTSSLFNALSDKGYDVQVAFDNGESTNTILLGQQGGQIKITITDTNTPLRAFTDGSFELTEDNIKTLEDINKEIKTI